MDDFRCHTCGECGRKTANYWLEEDAIAGFYRPIYKESADDAS